MQGVSSLPSILQRAPVCKVVHLYEHVHVHTHIACPGGVLSPVREGLEPCATAEQHASLTSEARPEESEYFDGGAPKAIEREGGAFNAWLQNEKDNQLAATTSADSVFADSVARDGDLAGETFASSVFAEHMASAPEERTCTEPGTAADNAVAAPVAEPDQQQASPPQASPPRRCKDMPGETVPMWKRCKAAPSQKGPRAPGWGSTKVPSEEQLSQRLQLLQAEVEYSKHQREVRRHIRELPDTSQSKAKQKLVGRMVKGTDEDRQELERQKELERNENRERMRTLM